MLNCKESDGTLQRTVLVTIKPTPTEIADAIWDLNTNEQIMLLGCLKRRFCDSETVLSQLASIANELNTVPKEKSDDVKLFVSALADYVLGNDE